MLLFMTTTYYNVTSTFLFVIYYPLVVGYVKSNLRKIHAEEYWMRARCCAVAYVFFISSFYTQIYLFRQNNLFSLESSLLDIFFTFDRVVIHCTYITLIIIIDAKENFSFTKLDKENHIRDPLADLSILSLSTNNK